MAYRQSKLKLFLQLLPVVLLAIVGIVGASQLKVVRQFLAGASGEPANLMINTQQTLGPLPRPWQNLAQGGEMSDWRLTPIKGKVAALQPRYIRLDHIYSFYDIYQEKDGAVTYDFSKLDPLIDDITSIGAKPYISLSYMPATLSSDGQITGPPKDWGKYQDLIRATVQHYSGDKKIRDVMYEVWNEPDLFGGWKTYGDRNYLTLYTYAVKGATSARNTQPYQIGGPGITALYQNWFDKLIAHAQANNLRLDFFSWHRYNMDVEQFRKDVANAAAWKAKYPNYANMQLHVTEYGHDSKNHVGYDTSFGAAHTVATSIEMVGTVSHAFPFEVEDGKDPKGQERWGRWGVLTHHDFGANIKPRYSAIRLLNRIQGEQLRVLGKGTWVKALAARNGDIIEMVVVNYDQMGGHAETVPITFQNVAPGSYTLEITELNGNSRKVPLTTTTNDLSTQLALGVNSIIYARLVPGELTGEAPPVQSAVQATNEEPQITGVEVTPEPTADPFSAGNPFFGQ